MLVTKNETLKGVGLKGLGEKLKTALKASVVVAAGLAVMALTQDASAAEVAAQTVNYTADLANFAVVHADKFDMTQFSQIFQQKLAALDPSTTLVNNYGATNDLNKLLYESAQASNTTLDAASQQKLQAEIQKGFQSVMNNLNDSTISKGFVR